MGKDPSTSFGVVLRKRFIVLEVGSRLYIVCSTLGFVHQEINLIQALMY